MIDKVCCILLHCSKCVGSFDKTEVRLPLGRVGNQVSCGSRYKLSLMWHQRQILSNQAWAGTRKDYIFVLIRRKSSNFAMNTF